MGGTSEESETRMTERLSGLRGHPWTTGGVLSPGTTLEENSKIWTVVASPGAAMSDLQVELR